MVMEMPLHVGDLDPSNPGLEIFYIQERFDDAGAHFRDARTGKGCGNYLHWNIVQKVNLEEVCP
jgi:hypothetical protein